jgi:5-methylcytosine-specific restriction protein A
MAQAMALADLNKQSVESALAEAATLGRTEFRKRYRFGPARLYFVKWNGESYDSKAIAGAAHGYLPGKSPLTHNDFSGGEDSVARRLRQLGFEVTEKAGRNPDWTRDELILSLDLYVRFKGNPPGKGSAEIIGLSETLNQLSARAAQGRADFRNPNGVYMKLMNFRRFDPTYQSQGKSGLMRGNKLEEAVWADFAVDPDRLAKTAAAIKANLEPEIEDYDEPEGDVEAEEGRVLTRAHQVRERSKKLVAAKKAACLKATGKLSCEVCGFQFDLAYGERGKAFIEAHHSLPVHQLRPGVKTRLADLHLLCANCHRMVHAKRPWLTLDQLKDCLQNEKGGIPASG